MRKELCRGMERVGKSAEHLFVFGLLKGASLMICLITFSAIALSAVPGIQDSLETILIFLLAMVSVLTVFLYGERELLKSKISAPGSPSDLRDGRE